MNEEARFVVKSLEMVVTEGGKNFSTGQSLLLSSALAFLLVDEEKDRERERAEERD